MSPQLSTAGALEGKVVEELAVKVPWLLWDHSVRARQKPRVRVEAAGKTLASDGAAQAGDSRGQGEGQLAGVQASAWPVLPPSDP